ncbi:hypothetical protein [Senegalia sp. (in: firmicutes)]|uniref:hypothetical protein n=1 Tax=Senegalia sp. (in: firmicutes) TaxID=1924098 RepID=UPI003F9E5746
MNKFIYILNQDRYIEELKEEKLKKYIPNILLKKFDILKEAKILSEIEYKDNTIGYNIGLSTMKNISEEKLIEKLEKVIKKDLYSENISSIIFQGDYNHYLENKLLEKMILKPNDYSKEVKLKTIPFVIKKIVKNFYKAQEEIELLIIYDQKNDLKKLIEKIPFKIKNIYIYKENKNKSLEVSQEILQNTGLSLGIIKNIDNIKRFDIIINFKNNINFIKNMKEKSMVFNIYNNLYYNIKKPIVIDDFIFSNRNFISDLDFDIGSDIYRYNKQFKINDLKQIKANGRIYNLENVCKLSNFNNS